MEKVAPLTCICNSHLSRRAGKPKIMNTRKVFRAAPPCCGRQTSRTSSVIQSGRLLRGARLGNGKRNTYYPGDARGLFFGRSRIPTNIPCGSLDVLEKRCRKSSPASPITTRTASCSVLPTLFQPKVHRSASFGFVLL